MIATLRAEELALCQFAQQREQTMGMNDNETVSTDLEARISELEKRLFIAENEARRANWVVLQMIKIYKQIDNIKSGLIDLCPYFLEDYGTKYFESDLRVAESCGISDDETWVKEAKEKLAIANMLAGKK